MKRFFWLVGLLLMTSCVINTGPRTVSVFADRSVLNRETTNAQELRVRLTAEVNGLAASEISWRANDGRSPNIAFPEGRVGAEVIYQAPNRDGFYTLTASTEDGDVSDAIVITVVGKELSPAADANTRVDFKAMGARESRLLLIKVSEADTLNGEALYFELNQAIDLELMGASEAAAERPTLASSSSSAFFATGKEGLQSSRAVVQAITPQVTCRGACIIQDAAKSEYLLRITNPGTEVVTFELYVFIEDYQDPGEPQNNITASASVIEEETSGAIERLGDVDYFVSNTTGTLQFNSSSALLLRAAVLDIDDSATVLETLQPGESFELPDDGAYVRVYVEGNNRAAASAQSRYTLEVRP